MEKIVTRKIIANLKESLIKAAEIACTQGTLAFTELPEIILEVPKEKQHGNFATNLALILAKPAKLAPRKIAELLVANLEENQYVTKVEIAGPGFINFYLSKQWLFEVMEQIEAQQADYGQNADLVGRKIQLEFVSANPVGPMNVVNARAAALGDTLANLFNACGAEAKREYYINDYGVQVETLGRSLEARYREELGQKVEFPAEGYRGEYLYDLARQIISEVGDAYLAYPEAERVQLFKEFGYQRMLAEQKRDLANYGVNYDHWFSERQLHENGIVAKVLQELIERGLTYESEGALWLKTSLYGDDKDRVLRTADGRTTYFTPDIAYHLNKFGRGFDLVIDIWGPDHHGYIPRMKAALIAMGIEAARFEVLIAQQINLLKDGQPFKMSKRRGEFITMVDLLEEVGNDAARWFFLMRSPESHLDFDLDLAKSEKSENPVFYVQYAHARIHSIFQNAKQNKLSAACRTELMEKWDEAEIELVEKVAHFPEVISEAAKKREPHRLTNYLLELATLFHSYYFKRRIIVEDSLETEARLAVAGAVGFVLKHGLNILGVNAPERM